MQDCAETVLSMLCMHTGSVGGFHLLQMVTWGKCMHCHVIMSMQVNIYVPWTVQILKTLCCPMQVLLPHC